MLNHVSSESPDAVALDRRSSPRSVTTGRVQRDTYHVAKGELSRLVSELSTAGQHRLPSEEELSTRLDVSRATIRAALLSLQKDGMIQRIHGRGTFINRHALDLPANISQDRPFADILTELGHDVVVRSDDIRVEHCPQAMLQALDATDAQDACVVRRIFEASGEPAVYCVDFIPLGLVDSDVAQLQGRYSVFDFVRHYAKRQVRYSVADIVPVMAPAEVVEALRVPRDRAMLLLQHVHIDESDEPVAVTQAYINDQFLRFSVVRTYTNS